MCLEYQETIDQSQTDTDCKNSRSQKVTNYGRLSANHENQKRKGKNSHKNNINFWSSFLITCNVSSMYQTMKSQNNINFWSRLVYKCDQKLKLFWDFIVVVGRVQVFVFHSVWFDLIQSSATLRDFTSDGIYKMVILSRKLIRKSSSIWCFLVIKTGNRRRSGSKYSRVDSVEWLQANAPQILLLKLRNLFVLNVSCDTSNFGLNHGIRKFLKIDMFEKLHIYFMLAVSQSKFLSHSRIWGTKLPLSWLTGPTFSNDLHRSS